MRTQLFFTALIATVLLLGCDTKPAKPPAPKIDTSTTTGKVHAPAKAAELREDSPQQNGY